MFHVKPEPYFESAVSADCSCDGEFWRMSAVDRTRNLNRRIQL